MAVNEYDLNLTLIGVSATCFLAVILSIRFCNLLFVKSRRKKSCYLNKEQKPQQAFKRLLADNSYLQFKHLKISTVDSVPDDEYSNLHPYRGVISELIKDPNVDFVEFLDGCDKPNLDMGSPYTWVDNRDKLRELVLELNNERVFAVDTEQHSLRSFLGFTALIQISTKSKDYLVDTIALHDDMDLLRPAFAHPDICKVFHGADNDILWLQRDFHIYVVNLFDTAKACDTLSKPQRSLAYLLEIYCNVMTNKSLQREDWRRRPLPGEMIEYARMDAHYLLYIASCLCKELKLYKNDDSDPGDELYFLLEASRRSNATCLQLFAKDFEAFPGELDAASIISRYMKGQGNVPSTPSHFQDRVRMLCLWRDIMARIHDESLRFVLSDAAVAALAAIVATTEVDICCAISKAELDFDSRTLISPVVSSHMDGLLVLLRENTVSSNRIYELFIQQNLVPVGTCPLSACNRVFLSKTSLRLTNRSISLANGSRPPKLVAKRASRELFVQKFSCKSPVYHNCKIYADDGRLLCYCDRRKLEWYLNRSLAKLVEDDPPAIVLLFEPKGRPEDEDNDFYIQSKKNICVGCGEGSHYLRYRIIPSCYRMHFPEHLKSHRSHDIVLLCVDCHEVAHAAAEKYKKRVAAEFGIPLFIRRVTETELFSTPEEEEEEATSEETGGVPPLQQLRTAAMALLRHGPRMPSDRREKLLKVVSEYYGGSRDVSDADLERALVIGMSPHERRKFAKKQRGFPFKHLETDPKKSDDDSVDVSLRDEPKQQSVLGHGPHGKQVVMHLLKEYGENGISEFCRKWRRVFVEALRPRFLPAGWDVMHRGRREFGDFSVYK
ncbi:hypothetical protein M569_06735, partial [Genlisea aurea]